MAQACDPGDPRARVISLEQRRRLREAPALRLSPEYDGIELLYANDRHPDKLFALNILAWALRADGCVVALVPWLNRLMAASELADPLNGRWEGFRFAGGDRLFTQAPDYKVRELEAAAAYFSSVPGASAHQEIPDTIGTHVVFSDDDFHSLRLQEIVSWRLEATGDIRALVADETRMTRTPVLPGDNCLVPAAEQEGFRYFFQHGIANRIKERDPETLAAIALLGESE
jgi:hypothetical protein